MARLARRLHNLCAICGKLWNPIPQVDSRCVHEHSEISKNYIFFIQERHRNKLKDYLTMAPALQVSHLLAFTLTPLAPSLRMVRLSNGPTLSFRVERYSLMKDVLKSTRRARTAGIQYLTPPLVCLFYSSFEPTFLLTACSISSYSPPSPPRPLPLPHNFLSS